MRQKASSLELELPEFPYGSVWLVGAGDGDPRHLSPLAVHALGTADAGPDSCPLHAERVCLIAKLRRPGEKS